MKTVYKPWGKEDWIELNENYCYKRIYINAGHRTSYQYHNYKIETNYIISGEAEIWLENDEGVVEKKLMKSGEFFNVKPPKKHRVIALTDLILQEVSTPQVDDVIRIDDDNNRVDGRLEHEHKNPAICILAAGKGTRLGSLTKDFNKGLLPINNKSVISHIIDKTPKDFDIIIAVGYKGDLIKQYCDIAHKDRNITYVDVDNIDGEGSGPGYSLYMCKEYLMRPFYFTTVDCLISDDLPLLDSNWVGISETGIPEIYSTFDVNDDGIVISIKNKSSNGFKNAFIGLCGILDFDVFWNNLKNNISDGEMISVFYNLEKYNPIKAKKLDWYDVGTVDNYIKAKQKFSDGSQYGIVKNSGEVLYKINNTVVKYINDKNKLHQIVERNKTLDGLSPKIINYKENIFQYEWLKGNTLYDLDDISSYYNFLNWCDLNLWGNVTTDLNLCEKFYKHKSINRLNEFLNSRDDEYDRCFIINGIKCDSISEILERINWSYFNNGLLTKKFHGDLQFDNVIIDDKLDYKLIDWRANFGDSTEKGDVYYDLAKLYGGIIMSYKEMKYDDNIFLSINKNVVDFSYSLSENLKKFLPMYESWILKNNYDLDKIKKITALIYLNMAPLHTKKFGDMLFFKSILMLNEIYK